MFSRSHDHLRTAALLMLLTAMATLIAAWAFELIGGYAPCQLCLQQRWSWYAILPLTAVLVWAAGTSRWPVLVRCGFALSALVLLAGAGIGVYQAGAEWKFWPGPSSCSGGGGLSGLLPDLDKAQIIRCDEASWRFLGLSFAGWNVLMSLGVASIGLLAATRRPMVAAQGSSSVSQ